MLRTATELAGAGLGSELASKWFHISVFCETGVLCFQYICENHFQRLSKMSMFTGLKAVNHFGRPDMSSFLKFVQKKHSYVSNYSSATKWVLTVTIQQEMS